MAKLPFTETDRPRIEAAMKAADDAIAGGDSAMRAGIDVSQIIERAKEEKRKLLAIFNEYFQGV